MTVSHGTTARRATRAEARIALTPVTVIGAGRAGSFACLALGMAGIRRLRVYDHDRLDPDRNLGVQFYRAADVRRRRRKVAALARTLADHCPDATVEGVPSAFPDDTGTPAGPIVVLAPDTMAARRGAADALMRDRSVLLLIDVRLGGSVVRCHTARGPRELREYRCALYGDDESWGDPCAATPDPHAALASASLVAAAALAFLRGQEFPRLVTMDVGPFPMLVDDRGSAAG